MLAADRFAASDLGWLLSDGVLDPLALAAHPFRAGPGNVDLPPAFSLSARERADLVSVLAGWPSASGLGSASGPGPGQETEPEPGRGTWPTGPVGRRFESLMADWLSESSVLRLLARNWPLREQGRVVGEVDLLVERDGRRDLWELACKWYLGVAGAGWIGPGLNDRLDHKLARLRDLQLARVAQPTFVAHWGPGVVARACLVGWLIAPLTEARPVALGQRPPAAWVAVDRLEPQRLARLVSDHRIDIWWRLAPGRWLRPADGFDQGEQVSAASALPGQPDRPDGMDPANDTGGESSITRPTAFAGIGVDDDGCRRELLRLVLVPPGWAERARVFAAPEAKLRA